MGIQKARPSPVIVKHIVLLAASGVEEIEDETLVHPAAAVGNF
jgi:hypothetical protein